MTSDARRRGGDPDMNDAEAPDSRRNTGRLRPVPPPAKSVTKPAMVAAKPASVAKQGQPPSSKPTGAESESFGRIHKMVVWLDANKGAFAISRLISQTGVNLRSFGLETKDDARVLSKLWPLLDVMLAADEREALFKALRDG